jgi:hypothetical protein
VYTPRRCKHDNVSPDRGAVSRWHLPIKASDEVRTPEQPDPEQHPITLKQDGPVGLSRGSGGPSGEHYRTVLSRCSGARRERMRHLSLGSDRYTGGSVSSNLRYLGAPEDRAET